MSDTTARLENIGRGIGEFVEKAAGKLGIDLSGKPKGFVAVHEKAAELLARAEEEKAFGKDDEGSGVDKKELEGMMMVIQELDKLANSAEAAASDSPLSLIPEEAIISRGNDKEKPLVKLLGPKIKTSGKDKEMDITEALRLAKEEGQLKHQQKRQWENKKDQEKWESISPEDRQKLAGMIKIIAVVGLDSNSLLNGELGFTRVEHIDKATNQPLVLDQGDRIDKIQPKVVGKKLVHPETNEEFMVNKKTDKPLGQFSGKIKESWYPGEYVVVEREKKKIVLRVKTEYDSSFEAVTARGKKIEVEQKIVAQSIFPEADGDHQEISLRQLLIDLTRRKEGMLADAYMTALINQDRKDKTVFGARVSGRRLGFQEDGGFHGIVVEGAAPGGGRFETLMAALQRGGVYDKWRAITTLYEQNDRFLALFDARNRADAQKSMEGGRLSRLISADNLADWLEKIPDLAAVLDWQEFQGFRNPKTGEPLDYPAVKFDQTTENTLQDRIANNLISKVIRADGGELTGEALKEYKGEKGDTFVLKPSKAEHKSMALINVLRERAQYLGVESYVIDLAFAFHRTMFTGMDKGISYNKAMTVGDFWQIADIFGLGEQIKENYAKLSKAQKAEFEKAITQTSIFQTGVKSYFQIVLGSRDKNVMNQDRFFREQWKDRAPVYRGGPPEWVKDRISWAKRVNWPVEGARREIYRWSAEFMHTLGKGLKDVAGKFAGAETPFNWQNQHHLDALTNHLLTSEVAALELRRVGLDPKTIKRQQLEKLIEQIFADKKMPDGGQTNFLGELKKFDEALGYERAANAQADDFNSISASFRDAVRLEKALESINIFGNVLEFTGDDSWSANQELIEQIRGFGGVVNEGSYDRMVHNQLYWLQNYLIAFDNFIKLRLEKEPAAVENIGRKALVEWQDQSQNDVRGTPQAFLLHYLNELNEEFVRSDIRDKQLSHDQLNKLHEEHRFWRDAVIFYGEPELDPEKHEAKVKEYCRQRMLELHVFIDDNYIALLSKNLIQLQQVKGLVDPDGQTKMFKFAVRTADGRIIGPGEGPNGQDSDEYVTAYLEAQSGFYKEASELDVASTYYNLDMSSTWTPEGEVQIVSKDGQGLFKYDILKEWFGIVENDAPLYNQTLAWYEQLRDFPKEAWEVKSKERYTEIPEILVGFAREYLEYEDGRPMDLRADDIEAEASRAFFRKWLYLSDMGGYQSGFTEVANEKGEVLRVGTDAFNKAFQVLMPFIWTRNVGSRGIPKDRNAGPNLDATRFFLYLNQLKGLVANAENQNEVRQRLGFFDVLMSERRVGKQAWAKFFQENQVEWLADKMTIVEKMADLISRDKMFSPLYDQYGEVIQQWLDIDERPDVPGFNMAVAIEKRLRRAVTEGQLDEPNQIAKHLAGAVLTGEVKGDIKSAHKFIVDNFGLKILPRGYWLTQLFRKVKPSEVKQILMNKLPLEKQARRWVFKKYGVDIGRHLSMSGVYQAINNKVPHRWRDFENPKTNTFFKLLGVRKPFKAHSTILFAFGNNWLDETFFHKPNYDEASQHLYDLYDQIATIPGDAYFGVLRRAKATAQRSMYFYQLQLIGEQLAMSDADKTKMREELRMMSPPGKFSWELLDKADEKLFGFGERQLDFNTEFWLTCEHMPMPVMSFITGTLASIPALKSSMEGLDGLVKKYADAPWGALPVMVLTVGIPLGVMTATSFGGVGLGGAALILLGGYQLANVAARIYMPLITKKMDQAGTIEWHPKIPYLIKKGVLR